MVGNKEKRQIYDNNFLIVDFLEVIKSFFVIKEKTHDSSNTTTI